MTARSAGIIKIMITTTIMNNINNYNNNNNNAFQLMMS